MPYIKICGCGYILPLDEVSRGKKEYLFLLRLRKTLKCLPTKGQKMTKTPLFFLSCSLLLLFIGFEVACSSNQAHCQNFDFSPLAVYRWKTSSGILPAERAWLDSLNISRMYLRFFDLDRTAEAGGAEPVAPLSLPLQNLPDNLDVVPVVFITNRCLQNLPKGKTEELTEKLYRKIKAMSSRLPKGCQISEWQMDCDWTRETRGTYFQLLQQIKERLKKDGISLSATIRLHQIKYPQITGIPPVDHGMLMFYNMSDVRQPHTRNSILDLTAARPYLDGLETYPLPLDIALPIFHWIVVRREGKVVQLLSGLDESALQDSSRFQKLAENKAQLYRVQRSTYLNAYYLYAGDSLRVESVQPDSLQKALEELCRLLPQQTRFTSLYQLDSSAINHFDHEKIRQLFQKTAH